MEPILQRLENAGYPVQRVNVEQHPELARRFAVGPIPCMVLLKRGQEVQRVEGLTGYDRLAQMFQQAGFRGRISADGVRGQSPDQLPLLPTRAQQQFTVGGSQATIPHARRDSTGAQPQLPPAGTAWPLYCLRSLAAMSFRYCRSSVIL